MQLKPPPPNLFRIAVQDTIGAFAAVVGFGMLLGFVPLFLLVPEENRNDTFQLLMVAMVIIFLICMAVLIARLPKRRRYILDKWQRSLPDRGRVVAIKVEGVGNEQRRFLHFEYAYQGETYKNIEYISRFWKIETGDTVDILVDPAEPERALLLKVFGKSI